MKIHVPYCCLALILACVANLQAAPAKKPPKMFTEAELTGYDSVQRKLDPDFDPVLPRLKRYFPGRHEWSEHEIEALKRSGKEIDVEYAPEKVNQKGPVPRGAFSRADALEFLAVKQKLGDGEDDLAAVLDKKKYGVQDWYTAKQLNDVAANGAASATFEDARDADDPVDEAQRNMKLHYTGFRTPRIRESWKDVLFEEDPSQPDRADAVLSDLTGASLSYTHDGNAGSDTWSATGALIFPWQYERETVEGWSFDKIALAPSLSIHRVDTSGDPASETDSLFYRMGFYANLRFPSKGGSGVEFRGSAVYATDTHHRAELPGLEFELEPRWQNKVLPIGYKRTLISKKPLKADESDNSALDYQLRLWGRLEGGDLQNSEGSWNPIEGNFLRLGPAAQLRLNATGLVFGRDLSFTAFYSYLHALEGPEQNEYYLKLTTALNLYKNELTGSRISLNASYERGGLDLTKEEVDTFTLGLGILF